MTEIVILEAGLEAWVNDPSGSIAAALEQFANEVVIPEAEEAIGTEWPGGPNPPSGEGAQNNQRPFRRTGLLQANMGVGPPDVDNDGLNVEVFFVGVPYSVTLIDRGYKFLPDRPYYRYPDEPGG